MPACSSSCTNWHPPCRARAPGARRPFLSCLKDGVTFTLVANDGDVAVLDAIQYVQVGYPRLGEAHPGSAALPP